MSDVIVGDHRRLPDPHRFTFALSLFASVESLSLLHLSLSAHSFLGEIDTLKERYEAQIAIESRWPTDLQRLASNISEVEQSRIIEGKSISLVDYAESHWHPQLYIENALGDLEQKKRYTAKRSKDDQQIYICEHRDVKGIFWEKLELQRFPSDVQDLSITIGSMFHNDKVVLTKDPYHPSGVIREAFIDQQEWSLYERVDTETHLVKEFLFRGGIDEDDEDEDRVSQGEDRKRSVLTVTCHAGKSEKDTRRVMDLLL